MGIITEITEKDLHFPLNNLTLKRVKGAINAALGIVGIIASAFATTTDMYVDPTLGNDSTATGTSASPFKTYAELNKRIGNWAILNGSGSAPKIVVVHINGDLPATDPVRVNPYLGPNVILDLDGSAGQTTTSTGTLTAVQALSRLAGGTSAGVTDSARVPAWSTDVGNRIRITSGARAGAYTWIAKDLTGSARTGVFQTMSAVPAVTGTTVTAVITDPYAIDRLTRIYIASINVAAALNSTAYPPNVFVRNFEIMDAGNGALSPIAPPSCNITFVGCKINTTVVPPAASGWLYFENCCVKASIALAGTGTVQFDAGVVIPSAYFFTRAGSKLVLDADVLIQGKGLLLGGSFLIGTAGVYDATSGFFNAGGDGVVVGYRFNGTAEQGSGVLGTIFAGGHALYGTGSTGTGLQVNAGSTFAYQTTPPAITGASDFQLCGVSTAVAVDPATPNAYSAARATTWALLTTAYGSGGFAENAHNIVKNAHLYKL